MSRRLDAVLVRLDAGDEIDSNRFDLDGSSIRSGRASVEDSGQARPSPLIEARPAEDQAGAAGKVG